jgi:hypothetical protein
MRVNDIGIENMQAQRRARRRTHYCADIDYHVLHPS